MGSFCAPPTTYQGDGKLILYGPGGYLWDSATAGKPVGLLIMQSDRNLVIHRPTALYVWDSRRLDR